jgi:hypothetical protein
MDPKFQYYNTFFSLANKLAYAIAVNFLTYLRVRLELVNKLAYLCVLTLLVTKLKC